MPAPARMHVGPHRGAVPAMNASRACEPGLRPPVSGREITKGRLSPGPCMPPPSRGREAQGAERADGTRPAAGFLLVRFRGRRGQASAAPCRPSFANALEGRGLLVAIGNAVSTPLSPPRAMTAVASQPNRGNGDASLGRCGPAHSGEIQRLVNVAQGRFSTGQAPG